MINKEKAEEIYQEMIQILTKSKFGMFDPYSRERIIPLLMGQLDLQVMPNEVLAGGLTEEEVDFLEMMINCQIEYPDAYEKVKAFADTSISRATLFSALVDYANRERVEK